MGTASLRRQNYLCGLSVKGSASFRDAPVSGVSLRDVQVGRPSVPGGHNRRVLVPTLVVLTELVSREGAASQPDQEFRSALSLLATRNNSCKSVSSNSALGGAMAPYPRIRAGRVSSKASHIWDASDAKTRRRSLFEG